MENKNRKTGRPVLNEKQKDIREKFKAALKKASPKAFRTILEIMVDPSCRSADRLRAAEFVLHNTFGVEFQALEPTETDREIAVRIVTVAANKTKEQEQEKELINPEDNEVWEAGNAELDNVNPDEWDVDNMEEDIQ